MAKEKVAKPFLIGLINPKNLNYDEKKSGLNGEKAGASRPQVGGVSGGSRDEKTPIDTVLNSQNHKSESESTYLVEKLVASHHSDTNAMEL